MSRGGEFEGLGPPLAEALGLERPRVVFDLETTGTNPHCDHIVE